MCNIDYIDSVDQLVKNLPTMWEMLGFDAWVGKMTWVRERGNQS